MSEAPMSRAVPFVVLLLPGLVQGGPAVVDPHLKVDQFGYLPSREKVALVSDPVTGFNAPDPFTPASTYEVRRFSDDTVAYSGPVTAWRGGAAHVQSGDRVYEFDFTSLSEVGSFYIWDPVYGVGSHRFEIGDDVYAAALEGAVRAFYYQRCGVAKTAPHAGSDWADPAACHVGAEQDRDCRWVLDPRPATSRDLSGGWHDAGDYNKYVNFSDGPVHDLLYAYSRSPAAFGDDYGITESGNGVPDVLDEVKVELDWMLRMQEPDGSLLHKVSVTDFSAASPPSADAAFRRYAEPTASATISGAATFAHAALVFETIPAMRTYAATLEAAALSAWGWLEANPGSIPSNFGNAGFQNVAAEDSAEIQAANLVIAAVYLFDLTGDSRFRAYVDGNHGSVHLVQWGFAYAFEGEIQDGMLHYGSVSGATASVVSTIESAYIGSMQSDHLAFHAAGDDAYRAWFPDNWYVWGSLDFKAEEAIMFGNMLVHGLDPANAAVYEAASLTYVQGMHGLNPLGVVYLSNMAGYGAEVSLNEIYHSWFGDGTDWDNAQTSLYGPAPGFVPGGPNPVYQPDPAYSGPPIEPPMNQPIQKSYRDWNTSWPENSWEVTEVSIYAQAAYVRMLSRFVTRSSSGGGGNYLVGAGLGPSNPNQVRVFDEQGLATATDFLAYAAGAWGANVASGEMTGPSPLEILTGPGPGAIFGPQVRGFSSDGSGLGKINFYAYGTLRFGVNTAARSTDGDAWDELLTGAGPGAVFGPHVRGFDYDAATISAIQRINYFAYGTLRYGVNITGRDLEADGFDELATGPGPGAVFGSQVRGWNVDAGAVAAISKINFNAFTLTGHGANVAAGDLDDDGFAEIAVTPGPGPAHPATFNGFDFDGGSIAPLAGFAVQPFTTVYGGRVGSDDVAAAAAGLELLCGPGRDPAAASTVRGHHYDGSATTPLSVSFDAFPGTTYGVNPGGGALGY